MCGPVYLSRPQGGQGHRGSGQGGQPALPSLHQVPTNLAAHLCSGSGSGWFCIDHFSFWVGVVIHFRKLFLVVSRIRIRLFFWHPGSVKSQVRIRMLPLSSKNSKENLDLFCAVFWIHDFLVWIRIRGSMPLTNGSGCGSGSFYFYHRPSRCQQKTNLKKKFFCIEFF